MELDKSESARKSILFLVSLICPRTEIMCISMLNNQINICLFSPTLGTH